MARELGVCLASGCSFVPPLAPSPAYDGQPAAEAMGWLPDPEARLNWLEGREP